MNPTRFDVYHRKELYHHPTATFTTDEELTPGLVGWPDEYELVASVQRRYKRQAYQLTQHIDSSWLEHVEVRALTEKARSTSVGDIILDPNDRVPWMVTEVGFRVVLDVRGRFYKLGIQDFDEVLFTATWEDIIHVIEGPWNHLMDEEAKANVDWPKLLKEAENAVRYGDMFQRIEESIYPLLKTRRQ